MMIVVDGRVKDYLLNVGVVLVMYFCCFLFLYCFLRFNFFLIEGVGDGLGIDIFGGYFINLLDDCFLFWVNLDVVCCVIYKELSWYCVC